MFLFQKKSFQALGLIMSILPLASCGTQNSREQMAQLMAVAIPSATHNICSQTEVYVRDSAMNIIERANSGDPIGITAETMAGVGGFQFRKVYFHSEPKGWGWVATQFICKNAPIPPVPTGKALIEISLATNRLKFFRGSTLIKEWNVATARDGKITPKGTFKILTKEKCPPYFGSDGTKNVPGCTPENPLGSRALWFDGTIYGLHGTNQEWLIASGTTASDRRLSAGCIRNAPANIEWLYDQVKVGDTIVIK